MKLKILFITTCIIIIGFAVMFSVEIELAIRPKEIDLADRISDEELQDLLPETGRDILRFGFDLRGSPKEDARQYLPFLEYMEKATGYLFELQFITEDGRIVDDLGKGRVHFAAVGAGTYIKAHEKYGVIPVARGVNSQGRAEYQSVIFVPPDSPIMEIEDIRGKRFAFGSITSTQGHIIPRIALAENGIGLDDIACYEFTGSHRNCVNAVLAGRFDAGGMQDTMGKEMAAAGLIRIIYTSKYYPSSGIAAAKDISPLVLEKVKQALIGFQPNGRDREGLYDWERTEMPNGFIEAGINDYDELRDWALKLGILSGTEKGHKG